jgi:DNA-binding response OmpR family regulator
MTDSQTSLNKKTILVVDDDPDFVEVIATDLADMGYKVITAYTGMEGLRQIENSKPDLLILDFMMPEMNGTDVLNKLRNEGNKIPVILITALSARDIEVEARQYEARYIIKPYKFEELQTVIQNLIGK